MGFMAFSCRKENLSAGHWFRRWNFAYARRVVCWVQQGSHHALWLSLACRRADPDHYPSVVPDGPSLIELALGYTAAALSTASFAPQAVQVIRSGKTRDISLGMYLLTVTAFAAWLAFGILKREWPLVLSNGVCLVLSGFILLMKLLPASARKKVAGSLGG
jgi:MtN3 and saliva related transmembrane protein